MAVLRAIPAADLHILASYVVILGSDMPIPAADLHILAADVVILGADMPIPRADGHIPVAAVLSLGVCTVHVRVHTFASSAGGE